MKKIMKTSVMFFVFLAMPLCSAFSAEGDSYSVGSYHMGVAANAPEGTDYSSRDTLTYQQAGNDEAESEVSSLNLGWFKRLITPEEEIVTPEPGVPGGRAAAPSIQFDIKILEIDSQLTIGESLDFTYFVKGVGDINNDVTIDFWIEKDGEVITSGSDVIFMGINEEITEASSLFLPTGIESGIYQFNIKVSFGAISAEAHRTIELTVEGDIVRIEQLFDIGFYLEEIVIESIDELRAIVTFENFGTKPISVNLTFIILNQNGNEVHREKENITVITENVLRKSFEGLDLDEGKYTLVLQTLYNVDVFDEFRQDFEIREKISFIWYLIGMIIFILLIWIIILIIKLRKKKKSKKIIKKVKKTSKSKKSGRKPRKGIHHRVKKEVGNL